MESHTQPLSHCRRVGKRTLAAIAFSFFLMGLITASGFKWTGAAIATETQTSMAPVTVPETASQPTSFAELAKQMSPTVVNIKVTKARPVSSGQWQSRGNQPFGEFFERFFKEMPQGSPRFQQEGSGSGVIISPDGYIVTNYHVIDGADTVAVILADRQEYQAKVVGRDPKTDLAVVKIEPKQTLPAAGLGDSDRLNVGDWVVAIGNPFGLSHTVTSGIVSAKGRVIGAGPYDDFIQTDASINPGNSGGPLFDLNGNVVGINTAIIPQGQGIGFAIPVNIAKVLLPQLMENGSVTRGYLGVGIQTLTPSLAQALELETRKGALVSEVVPNGPAEKAGIERGDVIMTFNGKAIDDSRDLAAMVAATPVGKGTEVLVLRDGREKTLSLTVGTLPAEGVASSEDDASGHHPWGLKLQELTPEIARAQGLEAGQGVGVVDVQPDSPAAEAGLRPGDILLQVNRRAVGSIKDMKAAMAANDKDQLLLLVKRQQGNLFVALSKEPAK
jgi:serine protease Do